jgi:hypothetical protein
LKVALIATWSLVSIELRHIGLLLTLASIRVIYLQDRKGVLFKHEMTCYLLGILSFESSHGDGNQKPERADME